ncbi:hypothetical protein CESP606_17070 [Cereibacter sphaeroides]|jgi:hypothetical protein|nr:hypothetical protein [Cereibacter sphaeroides]QJC86557.1 hypothetical protein HGN32_20355 [Cereibacter sphaeroides]GEM95458.1 hypothetical protein RSP03_45250 [Cereibacter sphaeroides]
MPTAIMADIQRQRNEDAREAVLHAIRGEVARAWLGLHSSVRERTGIVVLTNRVRGK